MTLQAPLSILTIAQFCFPDGRADTTRKDNDHLFYLGLVGIFDIVSILTHCVSVCKDSFVSWTNSAPSSKRNRSIEFSDPPGPIFNNIAHYPQYPVPSVACFSNGRTKGKYMQKLMITYSARPGESKISSKPVWPKYFHLPSLYSILIYPSFHVLIGPMGASHGS